MTLKKAEYKTNTFNVLILLLTSCFVNHICFSNHIIRNHMITHQEKEHKILAVEIYGEKGSNVEVRLNDIPVTEIFIKDESRGYFVRVADHYIIPGINTLSVYPKSKKVITTVRLAKYEEDDIFGRNNGETLIEINIKNNDAPVHQKIEFPWVKIRWPWLDTDTIGDDQSKKEAVAFSRKFYKIIEEYRVEEMVAAMDPLIDYEILMEPGADKKQLIKEMIEGLKMESTDEDVYDDLDSIEIQLSTVANGKLFAVKRKDGSNLFRTTKNDEYKVEYGNIIGRKNGIWHFYN